MSKGCIIHSDNGYMQFATKSNKTVSDKAMTKIYKILNAVLM